MKEIRTSHRDDDFLMFPVDSQRTKEYVDKLDSFGIDVSGFGDIAEVSGQYEDGSLLVNVIRNTEFVSICDEVSIQEGEYKVIE